MSMPESEGAGQAGAVPGTELGTELGTALGAGSVLAGRYVLVDRIDAAGTWRAHDGETGRTVTVRLLPAIDVAQARRLAALGSAGAGRLVDYGVVGSRTGGSAGGGDGVPAGPAYLVTEHVGDPVGPDLPTQVHPPDPRPASTMAADGIDPMPAGRLGHRHVVVLAAAMAAAAVLLGSVLVLPRLVSSGGPGRADAAAVPPMVAAPASASYPDRPPPSPSLTRQPAPTPAPSGSSAPPTRSGPTSTSAKSTTAPPPPTPPPTPSLPTFRVAAEEASPLLREGTCVYRVWFGTYIVRAVAKVQLYSGDCGDVLAWVAAERPSGISWEATTRASGAGEDGCGVHFFVQANGSDDWATGVGIRVRFPETGRTLEFRPDEGTAPTVVRNC